MILFIHGFGSCGWGHKSLALRRHFGVERVLAPDLPFRPRAAVDQLHALIARYPVSGLVGSSLGGFYATALNARHRLPSVLINPVVRPHTLLSAYLGRQRRWCDDAPFSVDQGFLDDLQGLQRDTLDAREAYLVLLQHGDEVLDWRQAADFYRDCTVLDSPGGNHRFERFDRYLPRIGDWLNLQDTRDGKTAATAT